MRFLDVLKSLNLIINLISKLQKNDYTFSYEIKKAENTCSWEQEIWEPETWEQGV